MELKKKEIEQGIVRFPPLGGCREGFSKPFTVYADFFTDNLAVHNTAAITHPDVASLVHPLFAVRKEGFRKFW
jgi:hypothetical protein